MTSISVLMPAFNAEKFIAEAIESILSQTFGDFEFLIFDDGSTDRTLSIAKDHSKADSRVRVYSHPNQGVANTLNLALREARHEWVAIMHADDVSEPCRLQRQLAFMKENPTVAVFSSLVLNINSQGKVIARSVSDWTTREGVKQALQYNKFYGLHHSAILMRKSVAMGVGGYRQEFVPVEDCDLWNRIADSGHEILTQPEYLVRYRIHGGAASVARAREQRLKFRWAKECATRRRSAKRELAWNEFLEFVRSQPWPQRLNAKRKDLAKILYKQAVGCFAGGDRWRLVAPLGGAFLLQPLFVLKELSNKFFTRNLRVSAHKERLTRTGP